MTTMLWYKSWLDTRWRFVIPFALLACGACLAVLGYPRVTRLIAAQPPVDTTTVVGRQVQEILELSRGFRGYVWTQWFRQTALQTTTLVAVLLGSGGLLSYGRGELYTLSLPVRRSQLVAVRALVGLGELLLIVFVPSVVIALTAPAMGESYGIVTAVVHAACLFVAAGVFFSLAVLLSTSYSDVWRPLLITLAVAFVANVAEQLSGTVASYGVFRLMSGEIYFRQAHIPWLGLVAAAAASAAMIYTATKAIEKRDY
jgi:hypothetical protein